MRKYRSIIRILAVTALLSSVCSCSGFLNSEVIGKATIETFFADYGGIQASGEGLHNDIISLYAKYYVPYADARGNTLNINIVNADEGEILTFNYGLKPEHTSSYPRHIWAAGYEVVTAANNILYYTPKYMEKCHNDTQLEGCEKIMGWAYFARALAHFCLCNAYGQPYSYTPDASHPGVPVVVEIPGFEDQIPRQTVADVYKQVIVDLETSLGILDNSSITDCTHINGIACEALLARVYLYMGDYDKAAEYSGIVMDKVDLSPREEYVDMFRSPRAHLGKEAIFRLDCYDKTTGMLGAYDPTASNDYYPDPVMGSYFDAGDIRKDLLTYVGESCETEAFAGKSFSAVCKNLPYKSISDPLDKNPYIFVLRASEMYLIHAEALCCGSKHDLEGAAKDIKALQARAKGVPEGSIALNYSSQSDMETIIEKERIRELCYEGHSIFDILRRGKDLVRSNTSNAEIKTVRYPDYRFILPINQIEMEANDEMIQNNGY